MKTSSISLSLPDIPRPVAISLGVIGTAAVLFAALVFTLGQGRDAAIAMNQKLISQIAQAKKDLNQAEDDYKYVSDNREKYEELLRSERLVPHTRRTAARQLQDLALQHGLTALSYEFVVAADKSVEAVTSQAKTNAYRVNVENINLKVGAPLDGLIYNFVDDLGRNFPGAAVVQFVNLVRAPRITDDMLNQIGRGQDAGLVNGEIRVLWRTAQSTQPEKNAP